VRMLTITLCPYFFWGVLGRVLNPSLNLLSGVKEQSPQEDANREDPTPGAADSGEKSKKSRLCVLL